MDRAFSDLVGLFKTWVTCRSEPAHLSRDFWMPDQSCRVCYECDSQFTLVNRRHHCRLCGRIFCSKCTSNWVSSPSSEQRSQLEECDKIRACNYCFEQWRQGLAGSVENDEQVGSLDISSSSPSVHSYISTKSSGTCDSSNNTFVSLQHSAGLILHESPVMETTLDSQSVRETMNIDTDADVDDQNFFQNHIRSDDDEEEIGISDLDCRMSHFPEVNVYYSHAQCEDLNDYKSRKIHPDGDGDAVDSQSVSRSSLLDTFDSHDSAGVQQVVQKVVEHDVPDEYDAHSSLYGANVDAKTVDFENNGSLWLPPEPEDEEDERETFLFEDDDEGEAAGDWGYLSKSSSFASREYRSRDKSNEEHKRAMKNVVDGHFRALVAQLLQVENLIAGDENDKESWLEIITALSWEAAALLKPDMSTGGQMDPGGYVKVKCLASGHRRESMVIKGVVCKKNVAHRRMTSKIDKPRLLMLGGALEYQRVSNALSSFDTLLQQEMDHLKMAVTKIDSHHPSVLLVEKSVSRYAQEYLLEKDISLVLNVKRSLLERIARCTGGQIVPSIDHLLSQKLGYCDIFHVEKFLEEHDSAGQSVKQPVKTLMYFEGCPKPLGCTILLRGANRDELKKVKHVLHYGVFAAYHLGLETSFLADEGASLPEFPLNSPITVSLPKLSNIDRSISTIHAFTVQDTEKTSGLQSVDKLQSSNSVPPSEVVKLTVVTSHADECSEISTFPACMISQFTESLVSSSEEGLQYSYSNKQPHHNALEEGHLMDFAMSPDAYTLQTDILVPMGNHHLSKDLGNTNGQQMQSDYCDFDGNKDIPNPPSRLIGLEKQTAPQEEFPPSPSDQQSILVSLSSRCVWKGTVCDSSHLLRIKYYGNFDKPLGRFLRDHLFYKSYRCRSCDMPSEAHVHCYTHHQGTLTISVKKLQDIILPGEGDGKIWMWHRCLRCPRANGFLPTTRRVVMSDAAWGLSFGKFLELSFSNHAAASRVASCGHSLHRDCLRFYGFGKMVACFRYASIDVYSVHLPPPKLEFIYENQDWMEKQFDEVAAQAELLFSEVLNALRLLVERYSNLNSMKVPESRRYLAELERMLQKGKSEFEAELQKILDKKTKEGEPAIDILQLNRLHRDLILKSYMWDHHLRVADGMNNEGQPDERQADCSESIEEVMERPVDANISDKSGKITESSDSVDADISDKSGKKTETYDSVDADISDKSGKITESSDSVDADISDKSGKITESSDSVDANISDNTGEIIDSSDSVDANISDNTGEIIDSSDSVDADANKHLDSFMIGGNRYLHPGMLHQRIDFVFGSGNQNWAAYSIGTNANGEPDIESNATVHGDLSDGQPPISLSETLDEAWTGANGLGLGITKKNNKPESVEADNFSSVRVLKKLNRESHHEDLAASKAPHLTSLFSSKSSDNIGHLGPSITDTVTSSDKNFVSSALNLDMIIQRDPIYTASFWDPELQGGARLLLPMGANDIVVPVYDDEPTSLISYALVFPDYLVQISDVPGKPKDSVDSELPMPSFDLGRSQSTQSLDEMMLEPYRTKVPLDESIPSTVFRSSSQLDPVSTTKSLHARVSFTDVSPLGKVAYAVTCYYAKHFEALRRKCCPSEIDFVRSLSRCRKWGAQGGKSNVFFAKTLDDRFIIKQVTKTELESFIKFAPAYFKYLSESLDSGSPTCLAKIIGIYQVVSKHAKGGKESKMDLLVMENLLFRRSLTRLYDLKGSSRSRYNADSSGSNKVLLDQNLIEAMPTSPIFVGNKAKRLLERAIWNDTAFLASVDVMDYSLLVGIDEEKHELVVGIIDFMRQYTWDKHLETWVKASGILGGSKNAPPTVISPKQYKKRFRKAMSTYFLVVPDQWSPPTIIPSKSQMNLSEENNTQKDHPGEQQTLA